MKTETGKHPANKVDVIDAYIIDELNKRDRLLREEATAQLPRPTYEMDQEIDDFEGSDNEMRVIVIDL